MNRRLKRKFQGRGFTLMELMMGMLIVVIITASMGGLALALSSGWKATETQDNLQVARRQTSTQMYYNVRSAKFIGYTSGDTTDGSNNKKGGAVMIWKGDSDPGTIMRAYQVALIEHDVATSTLKIYQLPQTASGAQTEFKQGDIDEDCDVDSFKKMTGLTCQTIGRNVKDVTFKLLPAGGTRQAQALEFTINYRSGDQQQLEYGTATVRGPLAPRN